MNSFGRKIKRCRMCDSEKLYEFLDLGFIPPADKILTKEELDEPEIFFPLKVCQCKDCGLTQLTYAANKELLYGESYLYESSITERGKKHFFQMAESVCEKLKLEKGSLVVDIGSNVGVLLEGFKKEGMNVLGIDPAPKIAKKANSRGIETWNKFISKEVAEEIVNKKGKAKIITGTNVFAHIDDKKGLIESLKIMLDQRGSFIIEVPYFVDLVNNLEYDTIYLDHLEYLSIKPLINFFNKWEMEVFDVEKQNIHGGTIRVFACFKGEKQISKNVERFLELEEKEGIYKEEKLKGFAEKVKRHKKEMQKLLGGIKSRGEKIVCISAPAKGNTLLNYCKIDGDVIDYCTEKSILKPGKYIPGMHIQIKKEEETLGDKKDYGVILAWNFAEEIIKNNKDFVKNGGKFIIPITKNGIEIRRYINLEDDEE